MQTGTAYFWPACQSLNFLREYIDNVYTNSPITTLPNGLLLSVDGRHRPMFKFCLLKRLLFSRFFHSIACCLSSSHLAAPWLTSLLTSNSILTIIHHFCCRGRALASTASSATKLPYLVTPHCPLACQAPDIKPLFRCHSPLQPPCARVKSPPLRLDRRCLLRTVGRGLCHNKRLHTPYTP